MRLYLSSFRIGNKPDELLALAKGKKRTALILNADDYKNEADRISSLEVSPRQTKYRTRLEGSRHYYRPK